MRLVFFGSGEFAVPILTGLADHVMLVVTQPDRPSGRRMVPAPTPVGRCAQELGLPVEKPERCRAPEFVERVRRMAPDALVVASYGQILSEELLGVAAYGGINFHGSVLPYWRGAAPIQWSIRERSHAGVTLMQMDRGMDTGDIIATREHPFSGVWDLPTYGELEATLAAWSAELAREWMPRIADGDYPRTPQDPRLATYAPKLKPEDLVVGFDHPAERVYAWVQAAHPRPGLWLRTRYGKWKLWRVAPGPEGGRPGEVLEVAKRLAIGFGGRSLLVEEVQLEGKNRVTGAELARGLRLQPGADLLP
ncbi:MAG: formyltransferase family protein [Fimbriimonadales bacterium]|nr:formyltransferase family protein [Fimbriimonadales bacterium]